MRSGDSACPAAGGGIPSVTVFVAEKEEYANAPVTSKLGGDASRLEPAFEAQFSSESHREAPEGLPDTSPPDRSGFPPVAEINQAHEQSSKFMESIRNLLRESPMKFKDLHLAIAQRYLISERAYLPHQEQYQQARRGRGGPISIHDLPPCLPFKGGSWRDTRLSCNCPSLQERWS